jgi:hypothetical protein
VENDGLGLGELLGVPDAEGDVLAVGVWIGGVAAVLFPSPPDELLLQPAATSVSNDTRATRAFISADPNARPKTARIRR